MALHHEVTALLTQQVMIWVHSGGFVNASSSSLLPESKYR